MDVNTLNSYLNQRQEAAQLITVFADAMGCCDDCFKLNRTFKCACSLDRIRIHTRHPSAPEFIRLINVAQSLFKFRDRKPPRRAGNAINRADLIH